MKTRKYRIEDGIPIPARRGTPRGPSTGKLKYPFDELEPGQSFLVTEKNAAERNKVRGRLSGSAMRFRDREFAIRSVADGVRVWRVS